MDERNNWVDYAKAIGIGLVVYGHVTRGLVASGVHVSHDLYQLIDSVIYSFHMPLFFFLSGLFFHSSFLKRGGTKLIGNKIDTIVYPYIVWSIFQGLVEVSFSKYTNGAVTCTDVFSLLWAPRAQFWFLYALFIVFLVATFIYSWSSLLASNTFIAASVFLYIFQSDLPSNLLLAFIANNFIFFSLGIFFSLLKIESLFSRSLVMISFAALLFFSEYIFHIILGLNYTNKGFPSLVVAIIGISFVVSVSIWASRKPKYWIILVGNSSMGIYLMHILIGSGVRVFLKKIAGIESFTPNLIIGWIAGVFGSIVIINMIRKLNLKYIFSAPIFKALQFYYEKPFSKYKK
ncbi:MAG: acyltransferase [Rubrivivax sp.]|nr:MAG: acyltransferase [Rubrivivax sp.]